MNATAIRLQTVLFTLTIFLSASLLFWVQPLFAKMILPILGGAASVWTTAMLFFQATLLLGYFYVHLLSSCVRLKIQILVHVFLLLSVFLALPFYIDAETFSVPQGNQSLWVLMIAAGSVGLPFLVLSATAPLLQKWFASTRHPNAENPYFLYAASNLGSLLGLLAFPFFLEPNFGVKVQTFQWFFVYTAQVLGFVACMALLWRNQAPDAAAARKILVRQAGGSWPERLTWLLLAFIPSSLMLGVTTCVTSEIAAVALFWVVPLALYLLTFVLAFSRRQYCSVRISAMFSVGMVVALVLLVFVHTYISFNKLWLILPHVLFFFFAALTCHRLLAQKAPPAERLTSFYLWLSAGGALGGLFNAILAPLIFNSVREYNFTLIIALVLMCMIAVMRTIDLQRQFLARIGALTVFVCTCLLAMDMAGAQSAAQDVQKNLLILMSVSMGLIILVSSILPKSERAGPIMFSAILYAFGFFYFLPSMDKDVL